MKDIYFQVRTGFTMYMGPKTTVKDDNLFTENLDIEQLGDENSDDGFFFEEDDASAENTGALFAEDDKSSKSRCFEFVICDCHGRQQQSEDGRVHPAEVTYR